MNDDLFATMPEQPVFVGGDGNEPPFGSREWLLLTRDRVKSEMNSLHSDRMSARFMLNQMDKSGAWNLIINPKTKQPCKSFDEFCGSPTGFGGRKAMLEWVRGLAADKDHGGVAPAQPEDHAGPGRGHKTVTNGDRLSKGQNTAARIVAKLKRDAPEYAERLAAGEFKSARAAGIAAGIVTPDTPLTLLRRAWKRASPEERETFRKEIDNG